MPQRRTLLLNVPALLWPALLPSCSAAPSAQLKPLTAGDFRSSGQRGVGLGLLSQGKRSDADFDAVRDLGAGHVRMFIDVARDPAADAYRVDPVIFATLDAALASLAARGLRMVVVASFGPDARDALWKSPRLQASAVQVWQTIATRLRGNAAVAGFDLVNEPVPPGLTFALRQDRWLDFVTRVIEAVRGIDPTRVLIIESAPDATGDSFVNLRPLPFEGLVYSVHSYAPFDFTHQAVAAETPAARRYPERLADGKSSADVLRASLEPVVRFGERHKVPIYVGEFSAPRWAPDGSAARYIADSMALFNANGWSWAYHEFRAWHGWDPEMASSERAPQRRSGDAPVVRALRAGLSAAVAR